MAKNIEMTFARDAYEQSACLEYSWIPEGARHAILLDRRQPKGNQIDSIGDDLYPSHVQVYTLDNNQQSSIAMWQFPENSRPGSPVVRASVELFEELMEVVGTVHYADGSSATDKQKLDKFSRKCPELPTPPQ